jgi:hypothetical protein
MIDCEKLKIAHNIMLEHNKFYCMYEFGWSDKVKFELFNHDNHLCIYVAYSIDDLITKLRELTQPESIEPGYFGEILEEIFTSNCSVSVCAGEYRVINGRWYAVKKIDKPEELTEPEPQYKEGAHIWRIVNHQPFEDVICEQLGCDINGEQCYSIKGLIICESKLYPTKAALIEAQIAYWSSMLEPISNKNPCKKCGLDILDTHYSDYFYCDHEWTEKIKYTKVTDEYWNVSGAKLGKREEYQPLFEGDIKGFESDDMLPFPGAIEPKGSGKITLVNGTTGCQHDYKKTLSQSGMYFISKCIKCNDETIWDVKIIADGVDITQKVKDDPDYFQGKCDHEPDLDACFLSCPSQYKCIKCGECYR